ILKIRKHCQVFVTQITRERTVKGLAISRSKIRGYTREVIEKVIAAALIMSAELWNENGCVRTDDTRGAWIGIGIDEARRARWNTELASKKRKIQSLIEWRSRRIWCRVRKRRVQAGLRTSARTEKHAWTQAAELNAAREIDAAKIESAPGDFKRVG